MIKNWEYNEADIEIAGKLQEFIPDKVFDVHVHLYRNSDFRVPLTALYNDGPEIVTADVWYENIGRQVGRTKLKGGLFIGNPMCNFDSVNSFVMEQLKQKHDATGLLLISPGNSQEQVLEILQNNRIAGFKPFYTQAKIKEPFQAPLSSYLPEWAWKIADRYNLAILVHLVRDRALADPENQEEIRRMCRKYPDAKLLLDHAARGFHAPNTIEGLPALKGLKNVWFDTSVICESAPLVAILEEFGTQRLMWGSDFPLSVMRGKNLTVGDGFAWLNTETVLWDKLIPGCNPTLYGLEALRALKDASRIAGLGKTEIQDIFYNNAVKFLGI